ncbi:MAG: hypothetical protein GWP08_14400 [Nitrospiraceae bacterium]|nr:hypothetical protein [Nitrospiraceae bacterium]
MRITEIKSFLLSNPRGLHIIKIETDAGIYGLGGACRDRIYGFITVGGLSEAECEARVAAAVEEGCPRGRVSAPSLTRMPPRSAP